MGSKDIKTAVAIEIMKRSVTGLQNHTMYFKELKVANEICYYGSSNPELAELIAEYTEIADELTNGEFSRTLEEWKEKGVQSFTNH